MTDTFTHNGREFTLTIERDDCLGAPWKGDDGHGIVTETRYIRGYDVTKQPGQRVLKKENGSAYLYDWAGTMRRARAEGWGISTEDEAEMAQSLGHAPTKGEVAAAAVQADFDRLQGWLNGDWCWVMICVTHEESGRDGYLGSLESDCDDDIQVCARNLANEICYHLDKADHAMTALADAYGCETV